MPMKVFFALLFVLSAQVAISQTYQNESKLIEYLGQEKFDQLKANGSGYLKFLDARQSHGFAIMDYDAEKMSDFTVLNSVNKMNPNDKSVSQVSVDTFLSEINSGTINYLLYKFEWDQNSYTYYRLGSSGKVLVIYPNDYITEMMNK